MFLLVLIKSSYHGTNPGTVYHILPVEFATILLIHVPIKQEEKRAMVSSAFGEDRSGGHATRLTMEDLRYLFKL
jgi:hypothetical protein